MKNTYFQFGILLLALIIHGCSDSQVNNVAGGGVDQFDVATSSSTNFVDQDLAVYTAEHFANKYNFDYNNLLQNKTTKNKGINKAVEHVLSLQDSTKKNALYLINYTKGGYVIISGDKRANPILAYSDKNNLPTQADMQIPGGLSGWINNNVHTIGTLRNGKFKMKEHEGWQAILSSDSRDKGHSKLDIPSPEERCQPNHRHIHPLMQTTWGQADGYNNFAPNYGCRYPYNGRAYAGCVATAIAQVMRYHEYPRSYNWSAMPNKVYNPNSYGSDIISGLMYDIGEEVDMKWGCDASGADDDDMDNALRHFGYSSARQIGYDGTNNYNDVKDEFEAGRPVIFSGCRKDHIILGVFPVGRDCHAWVSDGYRSFTSCPSGNGYLYFHMNWGWNNNDYNGFFGFNDFTPGDDDFDYKSEVVVGIQP